MTLYIRPKRYIVEAILESGSSSIQLYAHILCNILFIEGLGKNLNLMNTLSIFLKCECSSNMSGLNLEIYCHLWNVFCYL